MKIKVLLSGKCDKENKLEVFQFKKYYFNMYYHIQSFYYILNTNKMMNIIIKTFV